MIKRSALLLTALLLVNLPWAGSAQDTDFDLKKARAAISEIEPVVKPEQPRKVLVFSIATDFQHNAIEFGKQVLPVLGEETGAYEAVVSDDFANFEKEALKQFDAVIFNNTQGRPFLGKPWKEVRQMPDAERKEVMQREDRLQQNLLDYVTQGGGFVGIHAATDTYTRWEEYTEMVGGKFEGHPWNKRSDVVVDIVEPEHPLIAGIFEESSFPLKEEIYIMKNAQDEWIQPDDQDRRLLLKLNLEQSGERQRKSSPTDFVPISWIKEIGQGKLFYTSLGHNAAIFEKPETLELYLRGIQYACGDLPADASAVPQ
jgi:hypothetical protein